MSDELNLSQLRDKIAQKDKIISALMSRAELVNAGLQSDFNGFIHSAELEKQVAIKTAEYRDVLKQLEERSGELKAERGFYSSLLNSRR